MRSALERHNAILGDAIRSHGGYYYKTIGDAFQAAFVDPADAIAAGVDAQRALTAEPWPETGPLRVRMALHRGVAEPLPTGDYMAPTLNRLAPLMSAGYGGQVLFSLAVREVVGDRLPEGISTYSLGKHRLRDLVAKVLNVGALPLDDAIAEALHIAREVAQPAELPAQAT